MRSTALGRGMLCRPRADDEGVRRVRVCRPTDLIMCSVSLSSLPRRWPRAGPFVRICAAALRSSGGRVRTGDSGIIRPWRTLHWRRAGAAALRLFCGA